VNWSDEDNSITFVLENISDNSFTFFTAYLYKYCGRERRVEYYLSSEFADVTGSLLLMNSFVSPFGSSRLSVTTGASIRS
jgi:hypothetical protein